MKFSLPSLAVVLLEVSLSSSFRGGGGGGGGVNAVCVPGDPNSIVSFCDGVLNLDDTGPGPGPDFEPDGITLFCIELSVSGIIDDILDNGDEDFTIFAPTNEAFNNLFFELFFDISPFEKNPFYCTILFKGLLFHLSMHSVHLNFLFPLVEKMVKEVSQRFDVSMTLWDGRLASSLVHQTKPNWIIFPNCQEVEKWFRKSIATVLFTKLAT